MGWRKHCIIAVGFLLGGAVFSGCAGIGTAWEELENNKKTATAGKYRIILTGTTSSMSPSTCYTYTIQIENTETAQLVSAPSDLSASLSSTNTTGAAFYPTNVCGTGTEITSITIPGGTTSFTVYYKDTAAGGTTPTLTVSVPNFTPGSIALSYAL